MISGHGQNGRTVAEVLHGFRDELKDFATTRVQLLRSELKEKAGAWKAGIPAIAIGVVLLVMGFVLFTGLLVAVIALAFTGAGVPWAYAIAFAIVMAIYGATGAALALYGWRKIKESGLKPERTIKVLRQDGVWIQSEARSRT